MRVTIKLIKRHNQTFVKANGFDFCMIEKRCGAPGETEYCVIHKGTHHVWKSMAMAKQFARDLILDHARRGLLYNPSAQAGGDGETPPTAHTHHTPES